jgi:hypothetical protein
MIVFFALLGVSCKRKIPGAHTSLEVVRVRYGRLPLQTLLLYRAKDQYCVTGRAAHIVFMILCLINNIFACANMLLGAAAVITAVYALLKSLRMAIH